MHLNVPYRFVLSILSGLLLVLSFPVVGDLTPIVFIALTPLLLLHELALRQNLHSAKIFTHSFLCFSIFSVGTTWWLWNSTEAGAIAGYVINSLIMALMFLIYHLSACRFNSKFHKFILIPVWLGYEFLSYRWELSMPWLSLGNVFSVRTNWVQWYEYTGVLGGSLWVLTSNILAAHLIINWIDSRSFSIKNKMNWIWLSNILIPIIISLTLLKTYEFPTTKTIQVGVVQPNIDPYNEKFSRHYTPVQQLDKFFSLLDPHKSKKLDLVLGPETMLSWEMQEDRLNEYPVIYELERKKIYGQNGVWKQTEFLIGAATFNYFDNKVSVAAKKRAYSKGYKESYNTSVFVSNNYDKQLVHKSKLVLGVEKIPFSSWLPFLEELALENGGASGTLGVEKEPKTVGYEHGYLAPVVCYESIYGEFVRNQVQKGANLICVITNDAWWGDSPGYKQHFNFSRLRAIENRRWVARSANTGTSGFISPTGQIIQSSSFWVPDALVEEIGLSDELTFYSKYGDYIGRIALFIFGGIIIVMIYNRFFKRRLSQ